MYSRRDVLKAGAAMAAVPLVGRAALAVTPERPLVYSTGNRALDNQLGGGLKPGTLSVLAGPRGAGKSKFMRALASANGVSDVHLSNTGASDMLSIVLAPDGRHIGSLMLNCAEPTTSIETAAFATDPARRSEFLARWFRRSSDVLRADGGIFVFSIDESESESQYRDVWKPAANHVLAISGGAVRLL